ncbi:hypothetical protein [Ideonella livida]|uniref:Quinate/shikimate 5-dehydrogenase/glutamyl-tRNA reductase domain-containing protein n=1 Tax=Ideonella livida TaxID=2707176 RepID=A0A7C9TNS7_9BURK|nr:hypothetical protein [Ideonella livida]NDY92806.1 hypothetical protein [Ideonella livida]
MPLTQPTVWRSLLAAADWRHHLRQLSDRPALDVAFITNLRDEDERRRFFTPGAALDRHASGPRLHLGPVAGAIRGLNVTAAEILDREGRRRARQVFMDAVDWAQDQGARVVLLAASTKRLFGRDGHDLKARFPHLLFTLGDNGTAWLLCRDVERAARLAGLPTLQQARVLVVGAYGILGTAVSRHLQAQGCQVAGWGRQVVLLEELSSRTGLPVCMNLETAGHFDIVVTCTHSPDSRLSAEQLELLRPEGRRLVVVDVAEPANLTPEALARCGGRVIRQDAGNAHSPQLRYVLGRLSHHKLHLPRGTAFGCFAEAMALHHAAHVERQAHVLQQDWFQVNPAQMGLVARAFDGLRLGLPDPHCFGQPLPPRWDLQVPAAHLHGPAGSANRLDHAGPPALGQLT